MKEEGLLSSIKRHFWPDNHDLLCKRKGKLNNAKAFSSIRLRKYQLSKCCIRHATIYANSKTVERKYDYTHEGNNSGGFLSGALSNVSSPPLCTSWKDP